MLKDLNSDLNFEEEVVSKLSVLYTSFKLDASFDRDSVARIKELLETLHLESKKHAMYIEQMVKHIESTDKNEF